MTDEVRRQNFYFAEPIVGTPAYDALLANRAHTVTYTDKHVLRHVKRVKKKHLLGSHKKDKHRDRVNIKGKMIDGQHEQYILTMGMMMGIRVSVARALAASDQPLLVRDFGKVDKLVFPPGGCRKKGRMTPPHQLNHTFKFKDYAPRVRLLLFSLSCKGRSTGESEDGRVQWKDADWKVDSSAYSCGNAFMHLSSVNHAALSWRSKALP